MNSGVLPAWVVLPITVVMMVLVSTHMSRIQGAQEPSSRKRIRIANGWIMLFALGFTAAGFSLVSPNTQPRLFFIVWAISLVLITTTVLIAFVDIVNTLRIVRRVGFRVHSDAAMTRLDLNELSGEAPDSDGESCER